MVPGRRSNFPDSVIRTRPAFRGFLDELANLPPKVGRDDPAVVLQQRGRDDGGPVLVVLDLCVGRVPNADRFESLGTPLTTASYAPREPGSPSTV